MQFLIGYFFSCPFLISVNQVYQDILESYYCYLVDFLICCVKQDLICPQALISFNKVNNICIDITLFMISNHAFVSMERNIFSLPQPSFNHSVLLLYPAPSTTISLHKTSSSWRLLQSNYQTAAQPQSASVISPRKSGQFTTTTSFKQ